MEFLAKALATAVMTVVALFSNVTTPKVEAKAPKSEAPIVAPSTSVPREHKAPAQLPKVEAVKQKSCVIVAKTVRQSKKTRAVSVTVELPTEAFLFKGGLFDAKRSSGDTPWYFSTSPTIVLADLADDDL